MDAVTPHAFYRLRPEIDRALSRTVKGPALHPENHIRVEMEQVAGFAGIDF
jgi:hypothetical protein